ncbi:MAG: UDP-N-acetylmuramoyl-L-alanyl-D-glutamate--2,6-diaminopimelate ligase [Oscillospiraceae bacterium]
MLLSNVLKNTQVLNQFEDVEINSITYKTTQQLKGSVFVCLSGIKIDGAIFAQQAIEKGAVAIVVERDVKLPNQIIVKNSRIALGSMANVFFGSPTQQLKLIAVTGTNGKTSVATTVSEVLNKIGHKCGLFSTIKISYDEKSVAPLTTTPGPFYLMSILKEMACSGCEFVAMEASSHALDQNRLSECEFEVAIFTNLTQDHLDYHKNMEEYYKAKRKLFLGAKFGIINIDNDYGVRLTKEIDTDYFTYSTQNPHADFFAEDIKLMSDQVKFTVTYNDIKVRITFAIPGMYSVHNALAVVATCVKLGAPLKKISEALSEFEGIDGRCEVIKTCSDFTVISDYAHTPDGIKNIISSVKATSNAKVISVFGCGGDRDKLKRPLMAQAVTSLSDYTVITTDNPRTEDPQQIINDILPGVAENAQYSVIVNRKEAIEFALDYAKAGDIVLLLGKGHERYQIIGNEKIEFDERLIVTGYLRQKFMEETNE